MLWIRLADYCCHSQGPPVESTRVCRSLQTCCLPNRKGPMLLPSWMHADNCKMASFSTTRMNLAPAGGAPAQKGSAGAAPARSVSCKHPVLQRLQRHVHCMLLDSCWQCRSQCCICSRLCQRHSLWH